MTPLVSIIIPYYNRPIKLERCLKSVFSQSYTCFEIIVVDDCSTVPYLKKHQNANYLKNEINSGPGVSRNRGMYEAKGTYIAFLDCDDYWHPNFLEVLVSTLEYNANSVMAYALGSNVDAAESIISDHRKTIKKGSIYSLFF